MSKIIYECVVGIRIFIQYIRSKIWKLLDIVIFLIKSTKEPHMIVYIYSLTIEKSVSAQILINLLISDRCETESIICSRWASMGIFRKNVNTANDKNICDINVLKATCNKIILFQKSMITVIHCLGNCLSCIHWWIK